MDVVRLATPGDARSLAELRYGLRATLADVPEDRAAFVARCVAWMAERLASDRWACWVAERNGALIGALWLQTVEKIPNPNKAPEAHGYITNFFVRPEARNAGLGTRMLETALRGCVERGIDAVILWPTAASRGLYERHGFAVRDDLMELRPVT